MKWNLVGCTGDEKRMGYVWLEFERLDETGALQRLTAGIGMRAHRDRRRCPALVLHRARPGASGST